MPKMKTNRGAAKRFKKTASGGYKCKHSHLRHILTKKSTSRKRSLRSPDTVERQMYRWFVKCYRIVNRSIENGKSIKRCAGAR